MNPGYHLYRIRSPEEITDTYAEVFRSGFWEKELCVIVRNKATAEWLKLRLTARRGVYFGESILLYDQALRRFLADFPAFGAWMESRGKTTVLHRDSLEFVLYHELKQEFKSLVRQTLQGGSPAMPGGAHPADRRREIGDSLRKRDGSLSEEKLCLLAGRTAGLLTDYDTSSPDLTEAWLNDHFVFEASSPRRDHESWQRSLWCRLFREGPYLLLNRALAAAREAGGTYEGTLKRVVLIGSSRAEPEAFRFFRYLGRFLRVDHFFLDLPGGRTEIPEGAGESPEAAGRDEGSLKHWYTLPAASRMFLESLKPDTVTAAPEPPEEEPEEKTTFWEWLRPALRALKGNIPAERKPVPPVFRGRATDSLVLMKSPNPRRTAEAVRERIFRLLEADPGLKLTDVAVAAPDIRVYEECLESVLSGSDVPVPHHFPERSSDRESPFMSGFFFLLSLARSRCTRKDLLDFFLNACVQERFSLRGRYRREDLDSYFPPRYGLFRQESQEKKEKEGKESPHLWEELFNDFYEDLLFEPVVWGHPDIVLKEDVSAELAGQMIHVVNSLQKDRKFLKRPRPLKHWVKIFEMLMEYYLKPREEEKADTADKLRIKRVFRDLLSFPEYPDRSLDDQAFAYFVREMLGDTDPAYGRYFAQGLSCSSFRTLRMIPFKALFLIGLDEESFPVREVLPEDNLKSEAVCRIPNAPEFLHYSSFLELAGAAERFLFLAYEKESPEHEAERKPSPVIREFFHYLKKSFDFSSAGLSPDCVSGERGEEDFTEEIPSRSFSPAAFRKSRPRIMDSRQDYLLARDLAGITSGENKPEESASSGEGESPDFPSSLHHAEPAITPVTSVSWTALSVFLLDPIRSYLRDSLGVRMPYYADDDGEKVSEVWELSPFQKERLFFLYRRHGGNSSPAVTAEQFIREMVQRKFLADSPFLFGETSSLKALEESCREAVDLPTEILDLSLSRPKLFQEDSFCSPDLLRVGEASVFLRGNLPLLFRNRSGFGSSGDERDLGENHQNCENHENRTENECFLFEIAGSSYRNLKNRINGFLCSLLLEAGLPEAPLFRRFVFSAKEVRQSNILTFGGREGARDILEQILRLYLSNLKSPLPFSFNFLTNQKQRDSDWGTTLLDFIASELRKEDLSSYRRKVYRKFPFNPEDERIGALTRIYALADG